MKLATLIFALSLSCYGQILAPILQGAPAGGGGSTPVVTDLGGACSVSPLTLSFSAVPAGYQILVFASAYSFPSPFQFTTLKASDTNNISDDNHKWFVGTNTMYMQWGHYLSPGGITNINATFAGSNPGCISALAVTNLNASPFDFSDSAITERATPTFTAQTITASSPVEVVVMGAFEVFSPFMASTASGWIDAGQGNASGTYFTGISYKIVSSATTYINSGNNGSSSALDLFTASYKQ